MTGFLIIDDHPLFREALGNAVRLALPGPGMAETTAAGHPSQELVLPPVLSAGLAKVCFDCP